MIQTLVDKTEEEYKSDLDESMENAEEKDVEFEQHSAYKEEKIVSSEKFQVLDANKWIKTQKSLSYEMEKNKESLEHLKKSSCKYTSAEI